jgi:hypothetical protein
MKHLLTLLLISSCAHQTSPKLILGEVIDEKGVSTGMPNFVLQKDLIEKAQSTRAPASVMSDEELTQSLEKKPSLRRLYFRVVYKQWRELQALTGSARELKYCPQFHHDRVVLDESHSPQPSHYVLAAKPKSEELAFYPEWLLPDQSQIPVWHSSNVSAGFKLHTHKIFQELSEICESGASDSYYRLENMVTYRLKGKEYMKALLKIPSFSTMLLLTTLQSAPQRTLNRQDLDLLEEVNGFQLQNYIVELRNQRQQLVIGALK